jgi:MarR family transcriptional regulator, organic hydroperoxide resistance regulator
MAAGHGGSIDVGTFQRMSPAREERVYFALLIAAARLRSQADRRCLEQAGVTAAQAGALAVIQGRPGITQRDLAHALEQAEPSVTSLVRRLLAGGLVARQVSDVDRRAWSLTVTDDGLRALQAAEAAFAVVNEGIDADLTEREVRELATLLRRISAR